VLVLVAWRVVARLKHEIADLDGPAAEKYVRDIQVRFLEGGKE
jgi:hypothetical protein